MTFTEVVAEIAARLNLTSPEATTRIGREVNDVYRQVTTSVGINTSRRSTVTVAATISNPRVTFALEKIDRVTIPSIHRVLSQRTYDEVRQRMVETASTSDPRDYAIESMGGGTTTILLYPTPTTALSIDADGIAPASTLSGSTVPAIPVDYHDVLVHGVLKIEYMKMEKAGLTAVANADYQGRLSELRYYIAKSGYLSVHQGDTPRRGWMR